MKVCFASISRYINWHLFTVTTMVTIGIGRVYLGNCMEWLMHITDIVDHKTESDGELVSWVGKRSGYLLIVGGALVIASVG